MKKLVLITNIILLLTFSYDTLAQTEEFHYDAKIEIITASYGDHSDGACPKHLILTFKVTNVGQKEIYGLAINGLYSKNGQAKSILKIGSSLTKLSPSGGEIPSYNIPGLPSGTDEVLRIKSLNPGESNTYTTKVPFEPGKITNLYNIKVINKTHDDLPITLKLLNPKGSIKVVGGELTVPSEEYVEGVIMVEIDKNDLAKMSSDIEIGVFNERNEMVLSVDTRFLGPVK